MLIGYVSDERFVALADVLVEFERDGQSVAVVRSTPRGRVIADLEPGRYRVTLVKDGYGPKSVKVDLPTKEHYQFRLLSDRLLGYVWPKWCKAGELAEFRVHSAEPYRLSLWRYGWKREFVSLLGWFDEHGPRATMQITPDDDYTQTGVRWNEIGYHSKQHTQFVTAPERASPFRARRIESTESDCVANGRFLRQSRRSHQGCATAPRWRLSPWGLQR